MPQIVKRHHDLRTSFKFMLSCDSLVSGSEWLLSSIGVTYFNMYSAAEIRSNLESDPHRVLMCPVNLTYHQQGDQSLSEVKVDGRNAEIPRLEDPEDKPRKCG
eukprot:3290947-Amphidinium_carterae.1